MKTLVMQVFNETNYLILLDDGFSFILKFNVAICLMIFRIFSSDSDIKYRPS